MRHAAKLNRNLRGLPGKPLPGTEVERHPLPAPVVEEQPERHKCLRLGIRQYAVFFAIARYFLAANQTLAVLPTDDALMDGVSVNWTNGMEHIHFLVANLIGIEGNHWFHGHETQELHQVILHHVTQRPRMVVIAPTIFDPHLFGGGDGHILYIPPAP